MDRYEAVNRTVIIESECCPHDIEENNTSQGKFYLHLEAILSVEQLKCNCLSYYLKPLPRKCMQISPNYGERI